MKDKTNSRSIDKQVQENYFLDGKLDVFRASPSLPSHMMLELTNSCNHKCIFCANPHMQRTRRQMNNDFVERIIREGAKEGVDEIGFYTTGDSFMHKGLAKFTAIARDANYKYIYLSTNGALATPERVVPVIEAGINSIKFSINAASRENYKIIHGVDDWEVVLKNLRFISDYCAKAVNPPRLFVTCIITRQIEDELDAFKALISPLVDEIFFTPCGNQSGQMNAAQALLGQVEQYNPNANAEICALPFNRLHITSEGYLTACCVDYQNYLAYADLNTFSLRQAWENQVAQELRKRHLEKNLEGTLCGNCWLGRRDSITPISEVLADLISFDDLYTKQTSDTLERLNDRTPLSDKLENK